MALLRGVNVGGKNKVPMERLRASFAELGLGGVESQGHAGNVRFDAPRATAASLAKRLAAHLRASLGLETVVIVRRLAALEALVESAPFAEIPAKADVKRYVAFLAGPPRSRPKLPLVADEDGLDLLALRGEDVLVLSRPIGDGHYGFPNALVEKLYGVPATTRNWNTVVKLV